MDWAPPCRGVRGVSPLAERCASPASRSSPGRRRRTAATLEAATLEAATLEAATIEVATIEAETIAAATIAGREDCAEYRGLRADPLTTPGHAAGIARTDPDREGDR